MNLGNRSCIPLCVVSVGGDSLFNFGDREHFGPEGSKRVGVADLDHLDLGEDSVVQGQLLFPKGNQHLVAQVDRQQVGQLLHSLDILVKLLHLVRQVAAVRLVLKQSSQRLLASSHILQVLLSVSLFLLKFLHGSFTLVALFYRVGDRLQIKNFALGPVVDINVWVL